ncbi:MAG: GAF domain-containing protein [Rhodospirillaceae bacterium]|nr:GAF domain-containing protein [Rhodospirillaceae bacterium]MBT6511825.1 GAF domain-containing protein [Rhodospirillaceae bacterium]MBT7645664.1 GAF domain-containing protein [Rhodospirillaceae bacterium]
MMSDTIPADLEALFADTSDEDTLFGSLMEIYGRAVSADRCLMFLFAPEKGLSRCTHAWQARPEWALERSVDAWEPVPEGLAQEDPMFGVALSDPNALYIDNVMTADQELVNGPFELENFKHHSLVHAPLLEDGKLYGILEPCTMAAPRTWTEHDKVVTAWVQERLLPVAQRYIAANCP